MRPGCSPTPLIMTVQLRSQLDALRGEREKLRAVLAGMTDGVAILDDQGQVTMLNPAAEKIFGRSNSQALGHSAAEVFRQHQLFDLWQNCGRTANPPRPRSSSVWNARSCKPSPPRWENPFRVPPFCFSRTSRACAGWKPSEPISSPISRTNCGLRSLRCRRSRNRRRKVRWRIRPPEGGSWVKCKGNRHAQSADPGIARASFIESGKAAPIIQPSRPAALWNEVVSRMQVQAQRNNLQLSNRCPDDSPMVAADPSRI